MATEARKLTRARTLLLYKRINWRAVTRHIIRQEFERLVIDTKASGYPLQLFISEHEQPNEGTVQILATQTPTGAVDRKSHFSFDAGREVHDDSAVMESGGALVATQSVSGDVLFTIYPRKSARIQPTYKEILLFHPLDPADVTRGVVHKALRRYLFLLRATSTGGGRSISLADRALFLWIRFHDLRSKNRLVRSILFMRNDWGKILVAAALAYWVGTLVASKT